MSNNPQPVNFIRFHGHTLLVVEHEGIEYVEAKALTDLCGIHWKSAKVTLKSGDNVVLYGTKALPSPQIGGLGSASTPQADALYVRLDRARMLLARVSTTQMKAQGNINGAETLLQLQVEWAEALHSYETHGVAIKKGHREARAELVSLIKARGGSPTAPERAALTAMIADSLRELGHVLPPDPQISLPGVS